MQSTVSVFTVTRDCAEFLRVVCCCAVGSAPYLQGVTHTLFVLTKDGNNEDKTCFPDK